MLLTYVRARLNLKSEKGQALVEYALILSLVAVLLVAGLTFLHDRIAAIFTTIGNDL